MTRTALFVLATLLIAESQTAPTANFVVPNFSDTTIKTRVTRGLQPPRVTILRLKGARQRTESEMEGLTSVPMTAQITQCDESASIILMPHNKTYRVHPIRQGSARLVPMSGIIGSQLMLPPDATNQPSAIASRPLVIVTTNSEDTGERRPMGSYEAHHIKTTITVHPEKGAVTPSGKTKIDGWYLDVPNMSCHDVSVRNPLAMRGWQMPYSRGLDQIRYVEKGDAKPGYAVEETSIENSGKNRIVNKTELLEFSDKPLDASLFEIPPDYKEGPLPQPLGAVQVIAPAPQPAMPPSPPEPAVPPDKP